MTGGSTSKLPKANSIVEFKARAYRMQPTLLKGFVEFKARAYRMQPTLLKGYGPGMCNGCAFDNGSPDCMTSPPCVSDLGANLIFVEVLPALA